MTSERELFRAHRVDPHTLRPSRETRHVDRHPFPIVEKPLPRGPCPGPRCMTVTPGGRLCQFCIRTKSLT